MLRTLHWARLMLGTLHWGRLMPCTLHWARLLLCTLHNARPLLTVGRGDDDVDVAESGKRRKVRDSLAHAGDEVGVGGSSCWICAALDTREGKHLGDQIFKALGIGEAPLESCVIFGGSALF